MWPVKKNYVNIVQLSLHASRLDSGTSVRGDLLLVQHLNSRNHRAHTVRNIAQEVLKR